MKVKKCVDVVVNEWKWKNARMFLWMNENEKTRECSCEWMKMKKCANVLVHEWKWKNARMFLWMNENEKMRECSGKWMKMNMRECSCEWVKMKKCVNVLVNEWKWICVNVLVNEWKWKNAWMFLCMNENENAWMFLWMNENEKMRECSCELVKMKICVNVLVNEWKRKYSYAVERAALGGETGSALLRCRTWIRRSNHAYPEWGQRRGALHLGSTDLVAAKVHPCKRYKCKWINKLDWFVAYASYCW